MSPMGPKFEEEAGGKMRDFLDELASFQLRKTGIRTGVDRRYSMPTALYVKEEECREDEFWGEGGREPDPCLGVGRFGGGSVGSMKGREWSRKAGGGWVG